MHVEYLACLVFPFMPQDGSHFEALLTKAQNAWNHYLSASELAQGTRIMTGSVNGEPLNYREITLVQRNDRCSLTKITYEMINASQKTMVGINDDTVVGRNPLYAFRLRRKSRDAAWGLEYHESQKGETKPLSHFAETALTLGPRVALQPLPNLIGGNSICLLTLEPHTSGIHPHEYGLTFEVQQPFGKIWAKAILDANRHWLVVRGTFEFRNRDGKVIITGSTTSTYTNDLELPLLKERVTDYTELYSNHPATKYSLKEIFDRRIPKVPPKDHEFTLTAFGLPEPYGVTWERPTPWWLYAGIAAGVLLVLLFLLGLWKRRLLARS